MDGIGAYGFGTFSCIAQGQVCFETRTFLAAKGGLGVSSGHGVASVSQSAALFVLLKACVGDRLPLNPQTLGGFDKSSLGHLT